MRSLRQQGLLVLEVRDVGASVEGTPRWSLNPLDYRSINSVDVERAFHQIAVLLRSGVSILEALEFIRDYARPGARQVWQDIVERIRGGESLSSAMADHKIFRSMTIQLVIVGEQSGRLDYCLEQASAALERSRVNRRQVLSALQYPAFMILFTIGIVAFMLTKLIPELEKFVQAMGRRLPPITRALIDISHWFQKYMPTVVVVSVAIIIGLVLIYQWPPFRLRADRAALSLPVFGRLFRLSGTVTLAQGLGTLLRSGVRILDALDTLEKLIGNRYLAGRVAYARECVAHGSSLAEPIAAEGGFMPMLSRMIRVGEKSGTLDHILEELGTYFDNELRRMISWLTGLIAPTMTIVVGGILGFVYAAFLVAMISVGAGANK